MMWLKEGDANIAFFHIAVKIKAKRKMVYGMKFGSAWCSEPKELNKRVFEFFKNHFNSRPMRWKMELDINFKTLKEEKIRNLEI